MDNRPEDSAIPKAAPDDVVEDELVEVFDTQEESEAMVVRGLLESAGIETLVSALDAPQDVFPGVGGVIVRVRAEQAEEAKQMIDEYRRSGDEPEEDAATEETA